MAAPLGFLLLLGLVVLGIVVTHQIQLNQAVKTSARAVAVCGVAARENLYISPSGTLPNGSPCLSSDIQAYINTQIDAVSPGLAGQDSVTVAAPPAAGTPWAPSQLGSACEVGQVVEVSITYQQPLYLPALGYLLGNPSTDTAQLQADGEATC